MTGHLYKPFAVRMDTTHTFPSSPRLTFSTIASSHLVGGVCLPHTQTTWRSCKLWDECCHLVNCCSWHSYSMDHCCQRWRTSAWQRCQRRRVERGRTASLESGMALNGLQQGNDLESTLLLNLRVEGVVSVASSSDRPLFVWRRLSILRM